MNDWSPDFLRSQICLSLPVDLKQIVAVLGYQVVELNINSADAYIICSPKQYIVTKLGATEHRQRFSIAHEIGHLMLGHNFNELFCNGIGLSRFKQESVACEKAADNYAAELLMPTIEIQKDILQEFSLDFAFETSSNKYDVSLESYLIRFAQLADFPLAVLFIDCQTTKWKIASSSWFEEIDLSHYFNLPTAKKSHCSEWMDIDFNYEDFYIIHEKREYPNECAIIVLYSSS